MVPESDSEYGSVPDSDMECGTVPDRIASVGQCWIALVSVACILYAL